MLAVFLQELSALFLRQCLSLAWSLLVRLDCLSRLSVSISPHDYSYMPLPLGLFVSFLRWVLGSNLGLHTSTLTAEGTPQSKPDLANATPAGCRHRSLYLVPVCSSKMFSWEQSVSSRQEESYIQFGSSQILSKIISDLNSFCFPM